MKEAIDAYRSITATPEFREMERLRSKARHDEAQALHHAQLKGQEEGMAKGMAKGQEEGMAKGKAEGIAEGETTKALAIAKNLLLINLPLDEIVTVTGLTYEEVKTLRDAN